MDAQTLQNGFSTLDSLAREEYHETLQVILSDTNQERNIIRIGRLVGVILKEPFATSEPLRKPSELTAAYRAWHLVDAGKFNTPDKEASWQYQALDQIRRDLASDDPYLRKWTVYDLAFDAQNETGFFGYFARTLQKYICNDRNVRRKVRNALKNSGEDGKRIPIITPESVVGAGGLTLGVILVQNIPVLGIVGAPVIAAVVVILYTLGVDAFCKWSKNLRTDEIEKH